MRSEPDNTDEFAQGASMALFETYNKEYDYGEFPIATKYGFVSAYVQGRQGTRVGRTTKTADPMTRLDFVHDGRRYIWTWRKAFSNRYIVTLANQMAQEISS